MVTLAAVSRGLASHCMLTVALATVLCHDGSVRAFLEARKAGPGQKSTQDQGRYPCYPQAMSVTAFHGSLLLTKKPKRSGQSRFPFASLMHQKP